MNRIFVENLVKNSNLHLYDESTPFRKMLHEEFNAFTDEMMDSSFFVNDIGILSRNIEKLKKEINNVELFFKPSHNPNSVIIQTLQFNDIKFCASSGPEIDKLAQLGISGEKILYNGVCKLNSHIRTASVNEVKLLSFGTKSELKSISQHYRNAELLLRVKTTHRPEFTSPELMNVAASSDESIIELIKLANSYNMKVVGIETTLGSEIPSEKCQEIFEEIQKIINLSLQHGVVMSNVYIDGGLPNDYSDPKLLSCFEAFVMNLKKLSENFPNSNLLIEATDFIIESASQLCCSVYAANSSIRPSDEYGDKFYYINDGLYGSLNGVLYKNYNRIPDIIRKEQMTDLSESDEESQKITVWGPTCDSMDKVCNIENARHLNVGDILRFKNLGSLAYSGATSFNGFSVADVYHVISYQDLEHFGIPRNEAELITSRKTVQVSS